MNRDLRKVNRELGEHRTYEVKEIWDKHQEIIRLVVLGYGNIEIAEITGYTPQTISNVRNSPIVRERIRELQGEVDHRTVDIMARVREFEPIALEYLERIIMGQVEGVSPALRAKTSENYLSRAGHGTVQKIAAVSGTLTREDIEDLKQRKEEAKSAALAQGAMEVDYSNTSEAGANNPIGAANPIDEATSINIPQGDSRLTQCIITSPNDNDKEYITKREASAALKEVLLNSI